MADDPTIPPPDAPSEGPEILTRPKLTVADLQLLAGFLEGEGSFGQEYRRARVSANQVQRWPLDRCRQLLGGSICFSPKSGKNGLYCWHLTGVAGAGLMMTLYPLLSPKRQRQCRTALSVWHTAATANRFRTTCPKGHPYVRQWVRTRGRFQRICPICLRPQRREWRRRQLARLEGVG